MPTTAFLPSLHGFHFRNSFSSEDILDELCSVPSWMVHNNNSWGLCGGMCFAALDRFFRGEQIPDVTTSPNQGDRLFSELVSRQIASVDSVGVSKIIDYQVRPDEGRWYEIEHSLGYYTQSYQWPSIRRKIDEGIPSVVCLIRSSRAALYDIVYNHQVVAYGYAITGDEVTLNVYDPNHPNQDGIIIGFRLGLAHSRLDAYQTNERDPRGFLRMPYDRTEIVISKAAVVEAQEEKLEWLWAVFS
jgi:hypothetical protein